MIRHNITGGTPSLTALRLLIVEGKNNKKHEIIKNRKPHPNAVP